MIKILFLFVSVLLSSFVSAAEIERDFYGVIIGFTVNQQGQMSGYNIAGFVDPEDQNNKPQLNLPRVTLDALREATERRGYKARAGNTEPAEKYAYFFFAPSLPGQVFETMEQASLAVLKGKTRQFDVKTTVQLGKAIYERDLIATLARDAILAANLDLSAYKRRGWISVTGELGERLVIFVAIKNKEYVGIAEVVFKRNKARAVNKLNDEPLIGEVLARFKARTIAMRNIKTACSKRYSTVVLDDPDGSGYLVYALATSNVADDVVVGGHYRFSVNASGEKLERSDRLFKGCFKLNKNPEGLAEDSRPESLYMSHVISETPIETHIFLNLQHAMTFFVRTPDNQTWEVKRGRMKVSDAGG